MSDQTKPAEVQEPLDLDNIEYIGTEELLPRVKALYEAGYRFVCTTCSDVGGGLEVLYHFDRNLEMCNLSVTVPAGTKLPSITDVYSCAFLVENEMHDLFGLEIEGISIDYQGKLLISNAVDAAPMIKKKE